MDNLDKIFNKLSQKNSLTRADIAELLASMKGSTKAEKREKVRELHDLVGGGHNPQGVHVSEALDGYEDYDRSKE